MIPNLPTLRILPLESLILHEDHDYQRTLPLVEKLRAAGIKVVMVTGDHPHTALAIAREIGLVTGAAQAGLEQARAQADVQGNQARYSKLLADVSGVVTAVDAEPGAVLAAGTPVVRLAQDGPRDVVFQVPEDQVAALRALLGKAGGLRVTLRLPIAV